MEDKTTAAADPKPTGAKFKALEIEVHSLARGPMRLTECGGQPLPNGTKLLVHPDVAKGLLERHPDNLKAGDLKEVTSLACAHWELVSKGADASPTATDKTAQAAKEGVASNKTMAGKVQGKSAPAAP